MTPEELDQLSFDASAHLSWFQELLALGRETLPQKTAEAVRSGLRRAAAELGLELIEKPSVAPLFILLPPSGVSAELILFAAWHAEPHPVHPAALEGAERLALACAVGAISAAKRAGIDRPVALVVPPSSSVGSLVLSEHLRAHRAILQAPVAFWPRVTRAGVTPGRRRRVFLGARGRVVLGAWNEVGVAAPGNGVAEGIQETNPYTLRDRLIAELTREAFGPRPLDFELLRKVSQSPGTLDFLEESLDDPDAVTGHGEERLQNALFQPRGSVARPPVRHPDRPSSWITIETAEDMEPTAIERRARELGPGARIELVEAFSWDRHNIHHPAVQAQIQTAKHLAQGSEIWPMAPWVTPSGLFTKALGTPLCEWGVPVPAGTSIRSPAAAPVEAMEREIAELALRGLGVLHK